MADTGRFYEAAAGVIPLLYIALAVEERSGTAIKDFVDIFVEEPARRPVTLAIVRATYIGVVSVVLFTGIAAAFVGLAHPGWPLKFGVGYTAFIVAFSLGFAGLCIVVLSVGGAVLAALRHLQKPPSRGAGIGVLVGSLGLALGALYAVVSTVLNLVE